MKSFTILLVFCATGWLVSASAWAQSQAPCSSEQHRQFDFWLGDWQVTTPDGKPAGKNKVVAIQNGCVIQENWNSASGSFAGTSYNFYNRAQTRWEQLWLDNQGGSLKLSGQREGQQMILESEPKDGTIQRITWTANQDGSVRQYWQSITGKESKTVFDGLYRTNK